MSNNYLYYNSEYQKIIEKIEKNNLELKDIQKYLLTNKEKEIALKELKKLNEKIHKIHSFEIIEDTKNNLKKYLSKDLTNYLVDYLYGYRQLTKLFELKNIEEIIINKLDRVFIITRDQEKKQTNIVFTEKEYAEFLEVLKNTVKKDFKKREFIDGTLPDKSRLNIVSKNVCDFNVVTIRKFTKKPLTIIDFITSNIIDSYTSAFLWTIIDGFKINPANIFICGGTSSGKTTFLNALLDFIEPNERIILIEDTREVNINNFQDHVSLLSDITNQNSLFDITINTMRMRPDRIIIGEVRGKEVQGLFAAMDTGHDGCLATIHANNSEETISKLLNKPMEITETQIPLLDLLIIIKKQKKEGKMQRKITQITEISKIGNINLNTIYSEKDSSQITTNIMLSQITERLCELVDISKKDFKKIIDYRAALLEEICVTEPDISRDKLQRIIHGPRLHYLTILEK